MSKDIEKLVVKEYPVDMRPRERLQQSSPRALADYELLAILFGSGTQKANVLEMSQHLLTYAGGLKGLTDLTLKELTNIHGVGTSRACTVLAAVEVARRLSLLQRQHAADVIGGAEDAARLFEAVLSRRHQEVFMVLFLDTKNQLLAKEEVFVGTLDASLVHPRDIFRSAVRHSARHIICGHNHPSGDVTPSAADEKLTQSIAAAGHLLDIPLLDHIIVTQTHGGAYYSFREHHQL